MIVSSKQKKSNIHKRKFGRDITNLSLLNKFQQKKHSQYEDINLNQYDNDRKMQNQQQKISYISLQHYSENIQQYLVSQSYKKGIYVSYMQCQNQINGRMRQILVGWMIYVHDILGLKEETLHFSIMMIDKYSNKKRLQKDKYKLLGITCLFIGAKYQELKTPKLKSYVKIYQDSVRGQQILQMQRQILQTLCFQLGNQTLTYQLLQNRLGIVLGDQDTKQIIQRITQYILTLCLIQYEFCLMNSNYLSAVIIYIGCKMKQIKQINSKYIMKSYKLSQTIFKDYFHKVVNLYHLRNNAKFQVVNKKYNIIIKNIKQ